MALKEMEDLKKSIHDISELVKKKDAQQNEIIKTLIQDVLENHPGLKASKTMEFPTSILSGNPEDRAEMIIKRMPIELQKKVDEMFILSKICSKPANHLKAWGGFCEELKEHKKALDTSASGGGAEWIPTNFSNQFFEDLRINAVVAALFTSIKMPSNPYKVPIQIGRLVSSKHSENTADTGQTKIPVGDTTSLTSNLTFTAVGHAVRVLASKDVQEDSVIPMLSFLTAEIMRALRDGRENCILNGDTGGSHEDTDITDAADNRKLWLGLRRHANANSYKTDLQTLNLSTIRTGLRGKMGKYGVMPGKLAYVTGLSGYIKLVDLGEVTTIDKYGPGATVLTGELGKIDGSPLIVSEWVREVLNSNAIYAAGQTKTVLHAVYRDGFAIGERRQATVQLLSELYAESDQDALITRERVDFEPVYPIASNKLTWMGSNIAV